MADTKSYLLALCVGLLVGIIYALLNVRSPAPPVVALVGLLGILLGEQIVPLAKRLSGGSPLTVAVVQERCGEHVLGVLPACGDAASTPISTQDVRS
jgi:XapX domain-containing protein